MLGGILCGLIAAYLWQRYYRISLPPYLAFFGGRRFVPIVTGFATMTLAVLLRWSTPLRRGPTAVGEWVAQNEVVGGFFYGTFNRLLIPLGLHHILTRSLVPPGEYTPRGWAHGAGRHRALPLGRPTAGAFMTGFFPIMMFSLPRPPSRSTRRPSRGEEGHARIMASAALCLFLTGVTEPLEFAFMFVAWPRT